MGYRCAAYMIYEYIYGSVDLGDGDGLLVGRREKERETGKREENSPSPKTPSRCSRLDVRFEVGCRAFMIVSSTFGDSLVILLQ